MDNRITKKRLSDFLAYEWILTLIIIAVAIIVWEFIYTITAVQLTVGQEFKLFYDENIADPQNLFFDVMDKDVFSYDVLSVKYEGLVKSQNVLNERLTIRDGDVIVTDCTLSVNASGNEVVRSEYLIDGLYYIYNFEKLQNDLSTYLKSFLADGNEGEKDYLEYEKLDGEKIGAHFSERMKGDNRYKTETEKADGKEEEKLRIKKLCAVAKDFEFLLDNSNTYDIFYKYQRTENGVKSPEKNYGIMVEKLTGGAYQTADFFKMMEKDDSKNVIMMMFDFLSYQPDLQFEGLSFVMEVVSKCSDIPLPSRA